MTGPPLPVPPTTGRSQLDLYRWRLGAALHATTAAAERWAETGAWLEPDAGHYRRDAAHDLPGPTVEGYPDALRMA
jgi:hypothetical protein